jgi:Lysozyme like domain
MTYSPSQIFDSLIGQGATQQQATTLTAISGAESGFGASTTSPVNKNGTTDFGVFQINSGAWPQYGGSQVNSLTLDQQSAAALHIYNTQGPTAWSTCNSGAYTKYLSQVGSTSGATSDAIGGDAYSNAFGSDSTGLNTTDTSNLNTTGIFNNLDDDTFDTTPLVGGIGSDAVAGQTAGSLSGDSIDWGDLSDNTFDADTPAASSVANVLSPSAMTGISSAGAVGTQGSVGSIGAGGINVNLTDESGLPSSVSGAGTAVQKGATTAGSDIQTAAGGIAGTAASAVNNLQTYASGAVVTIGLIVFGLVFVAFGLSMFKGRLLPDFVRG